MDVPDTRYARSGDVSIAYQVTGQGPFDLVHVPGFVSHVELVWNVPGQADFIHRLSSFCRLIRFDKRGTGMEIDTAGDGFFASFDGPARAIRCACAISEGVRELGIEIRAGLQDLVAGSGIAFRDRGSAELKGVPGEWRLFAVEAVPV